MSAQPVPAPAPRYTAKEHAEDERMEARRAREIKALRLGAFAQSLAAQAREIYLARASMENCRKLGRCAVEIAPGIRCAMPGQFFELDNKRHLCAEHGPAIERKAA